MWKTAFLSLVIEFYMHILQKQISFAKKDLPRIVKIIGER